MIAPNAAARLTRAGETDRRALATQPSSQHDGMHGSGLLGADFQV